MDIKFKYDNILIMDCEKFLSISHCFFPVSSCKNRIMLSVQGGQMATTTQIARDRVHTSAVYAIVASANGFPKFPSVCLLL